MSQENSGPPTGEQQVKAAFAALAVGSMLAAGAVYLLRGALGIPDDTARLISSAFVVAAFVDALVLYFWDRIYKRPKK